MSFDEALKIVRKEFKNNYIPYGFDYGESYLFLVYSGTEFFEGDLTTCCVKVNKFDNKISYSSYFDEFMSHNEKINECEKNIIFIDMKKELFDMYRKGKIITPFGYIDILIDGVSFDYKYINETLSKEYPNVLGRYFIKIDYIPDGKKHTINCIVDNIEFDESSPESDENIERQAFYRNDYKLSISIKAEISSLDNVFDYSCNYLKNGMSYEILESTKTNSYMFGISWIKNPNNDIELDNETYFASDIIDFENSLKRK